MKTSERLMWVFGILFLLCGVCLPFLGKDNPDPRATHLLAGAATLFLGGFVLALAWNAVATGEIKVQHFNFTRSGQPRRFFATVVVVVCAGCGTLVAALWFLLFKQPNG